MRWYRGDDKAPKSGDLRFEEDVVTKKGDPMKIVKRSRTLQYFNGYYWENVPCISRTREERSYEVD